MNSNRFETWKTIKNYPKYKVSSYGRVMNISTDEIIKQRKYGDYYQVTLSNESSKNDRHYMQNLVYNAFYGDIPQYTKIEHIDGDVSNNSFWNLRIVEITEPLKETFIKLTTNEITKLSDSPLLVTLIYSYIKNIIYNNYGKDEIGIIILKMKSCISKFGSLIKKEEDLKIYSILDTLGILAKKDLIKIINVNDNEVRLTLTEI